jgi:hypothetical protein
MGISLRINKKFAALNYEQYEYNEDTYCNDGIQHDWHCMAYAIYLLQQYHNGELGCL